MTVGDIEVSGNPVLESLEGWRELQLIGVPNISLLGNRALKTLGDWSWLTNANALSLTSLDELTSLEGLSALREVGRLTLMELPKLTSLGDFKNLRTATETIEIAACDALPNLKGLDALETTPRLEISSARSLSDLDGLGRLKTIGELTLSDLPALTSLAKLTGLTSLTRLLATRAGVRDLRGLERITHLEGLGLEHNRWLATLDGASAVETIEGFLTLADNPALVSLRGVSSLSLVGSAHLARNRNLSTCEVEWLSTRVDPSVIASEENAGDRDCRSPAPPLPAGLTWWKHYDAAYGSFTSARIMPDGTIVTSGNDGDLGTFVAKLSNTGEPIWTRYTQPSSIASDERAEQMGCLLVDSHGTISLPTTLFARAQTTVYQFSASGDVLPPIVVPIAGAGWFTCEHDSQDAVYLGFSSDADANTPTAGTVVKRDAAWNELWRKRLSIDGAMPALLYPGVIATTSDGLAVAENSADSQSLSAIAKLRPDGTQLWQTVIHQGLIRSMRVAANGDIVAVGTGQGTLEVGTTQLTTSRSNGAVFMLQLSADGAVKTLRFIGVGEGAPQLALAADGSPYIFAGLGEVFRLEADSPTNIFLAKLDSTGRATYFAALDPVVVPHNGGQSYMFGDEIIATPDRVLVVGSLSSGAVLLNFAP